MFIKKENLGEYKILLPNGASECLKYSAKILCDYLNKITAVKLLIKESVQPSEKFLSLGDTPQSGWLNAKITQIESDDGFLVDSKDGNLFILGKTERGTMYGVIDYLERFLNVRFFTPDCEAVPTADELPLPTDFKHEPPLRMRTYITGHNYDDERREGYITPKIDFLVKTKTRDVFTEIDGKHGGKVEIYGRNISHNFHFYVPYEKYGESHPEFYKEITVNGEKTHTIDITNGLLPNGEIDQSKQESVVKIVIEEMKKDILKYPKVKVFLLTQEDGDEYFDDEFNRQEEMKYKRSGMLIRFCNAVVRALNAWAQKELAGRVIKLATFAYAYCQNAPVKYDGEKILPLCSSVVADENLIIQLAFFSNPRFSYFDERQVEKTKRSLKEWKAIGKQFWVWAYDADFSNYLSNVDSFHTIKDNVKGFIDYGIDYLCINGAYDTDYCWQGNLRAYAYRRLMWDDSLNAEDLLNDYIENYYGPSANSVKEYISAVKRAFSSFDNSDLPVYAGTWGTHTYPEYYSKDLVEKTLKIIDGGRKLIQDSALSDCQKQIFLKRLLCVKVSILNLKYLNFKEYYPTLSEDERLIAKDEFISVAKQAGVENARERMSLQAYVDFVESDDYKIRPTWVNKKGDCNGKV